MSKLDLTYANRGLDLKTLAVHNGRFHADDVFAAMLLRLIYPGIEVIRSRDETVLDKCDIVVDVGLLYSDKELRYDHHQDGKAGKRENGIEYSGFGLIWKHWGIEVCEGNKELYDEIDKILVQPIDAHDNSQPLYEKENFEGINVLSIDGVMSSAFNVLGYPDDESLIAFKEAMDFSETIFSRIFLKKKELLRLKEDIVMDYKSLEDKRYILDEEYRPVLAFRDSMPELLFYVFATEDGRWMMKCAREKEFVNRKLLPEEWAGKRDEELEEVSGIKGMYFCHNNLFICGAKNKEAILKALQKALDY